VLRKRIWELENEGSVLTDSTAARSNITIDKFNRIMGVAGTQYTRRKGLLGNEALNISASFPAKRTRANTLFKRRQSVMQKSGSNDNIENDESVANRGDRLAQTMPPAV
jgi:hypothetical protein